jgi:hypothetical protein
MAKPPPFFTHPYFSSTMKHLLKSSTLVAAMFTLALALPAHAGVNAQAQLSHLGFELIDLNTNDGITPSISFTPDFLDSFTFSEDRISRQSEHLNHSSSDFNAVDLHTRTPYSYSNAVYQGGATGGLLVNGSSTKGSYGNEITRLMNFKLSANTKLVFLGDMQAITNADNQATTKDRATTLAQLSWGVSSSPVDTVYSYLEANNSLTQHANLRDSFRLALNNTSPNQERSGFMKISVTTNGYAVSAVPEADSWAMMGLGVFALAALARRRAVQK